MAYRARAMIICSPLLALLGVVAEDNPVPHEATDWALGTTHEYSLNGVAAVPSYGNVAMQLTVDLTVIDRTRSGVRLVELMIPRSPLLTDRAGLLHSLRSPFNVESHPFYYRQGADGHLIDVYHSPEETWESLSMKRELVSSQQMAGMPTAVSRRSLKARDRFVPASGWKTIERDVGGSATARYHMHARRGGWRVRKRLLYEEEDQCAALPFGLSAPPRPSDPAGRSHTQVGPTRGQHDRPFAS